jgi:hypothetical protein
MGDSGFASADYAGDGGSDIMEAQRAGTIAVADTPFDQDKDPVP